MRRSIVVFFIIIFWSGSINAQNREYATLLNELIRLYSSGQMKKACSYSDSILYLFKSQKKKQDTIYPYILYYSSIVNGFQKNWNKCAKLLPELEQVCLKRYGKNDIKYWSALDFQRQLVTIKTDWEKRL